jgi:hypothetical protein
MLSGRATCEATESSVVGPSAAESLSGGLGPKWQWLNARGQQQASLVACENPVVWPRQEQARQVVADDAPLEGFIFLKGEQMGRGSPPDFSSGP